MIAETTVDNSVAIVATMDTKQVEASFVADIVRGAGRSVLFVDVGTSKDGRFRSNDPAVLLAGIAREARKSVNGLFETGKVSAVIGIGGGKGSGVFGEVVADLPYGFPKLLVSSARPALLAELAGKLDVLLYPTLVDLFGVNGFTSRVLENAARAIAAMHYLPKAKSRRKIVAITSFGVTTPAANACVRLLGDKKMEAIVFPANGAGGRKMESLVDAGEFDAVIDLTTTELADELLGGTASAGPDRLTAAGRCGIPQLIAPGAVDMVNFGVLSSVPPEFAERRLYAHTPYTTLLRTTPEETNAIGRLTAQKLSASRGPAQVLWPSKGVSDYDREGGPFHDPEANRAWLSGLRAALPGNIPVRELNCHINDPEFASAAVEWVLDHIDTETADENV
ncbi:MULTISPECIES: Tm-1-like ATP-binding domain-containing protein [unclassified Mesorhizobium]|uniref:Tm-1-like ATP-binding domain-containing protein n=1 Tax=unclassified Mesorhizobium TaxID=325217 RepID=UPI000AC4A10A|nr:MULTISPECIES: Tm-1-like ATP-binding domain-containing protein [unclassified Mesorhizobium]MCA0030553.1 Tm-1-like ATP-binding domain-containing protein [Mesorhizobium sp. B263B2A]MCA0000307.1 Tm-1-like ATP-binding domain-containing protein [Mesorhizobium sp. B264B2A]MCA0006359.1 Tm-1-like ATP-binding domain-containing protein [Mesorhizobium sp. B264B1B]MCA0014653.1 Tm-1-like ATP-binding domain-containing protein [Mesorhizobium sp. B294B1A1]MCA0022017.1 Tm-1-like ATP-binding domain-containing